MHIKIQHKMNRHIYNHLICKNPKIKFTMKHNKINYLDIKIIRNYNKLQ